MDVRLRENLTFLHIPKCGGTSVFSYLHQFISDDDIFDRNLLVGWPEYKKLNATRPCFFVGHLGYSFFRECGGASITLLRDPVERILSLYSYWKNPGKGMPPGPPLPSDMDIRGFLASDVPHIRMNIDNAQTWQIAFWHNPATRRRLAGLTECELLDIAISNLRRIDVIGINEEMEAFSVSLLNFFLPHGRPDPVHPIKRQNTSVDRISASNLDSDVISQIRDRVMLDCALYDEGRRLAGV